MTRGRVGGRGLGGFCRVRASWGCGGGREAESPRCGGQCNTWGGDGQGVPTPWWQMVSPSGFGVESTPRSWGRKNPQTPGRACWGGGAWNQDGKDICQVVLCVQVQVCCLSARSGRRVGYGVREKGLWTGGRPVNSTRAFPGAPHPPDGSVSKEVCRGHSSAGALLAAGFRTAGSGRTEPVARGNWKGQDAVFLELGAFSRRYRVCASLGCTLVGSQRTTLHWALAMASSSNSVVKCGARVPTCRLSRNLPLSWPR